MKNASAQTVGLQLVGALSCLLFLPFFEFKLPSNPWVYFFLTLSCVFYALNNYMLAGVRKNLEASTMGILQQFYTVMITLAGFVLYGEAVTPFKLLGIALIIAGNIMVFWQHGRVKSKKYVLVGLLAYLCNVVAGIIDINHSGEFSLPLYVALLYAIPAMFIFLGKRVHVNEIKKEFKRANKRDYLLTGFCWSMHYFVLLIAYSMGEVSTITPITSLAVFVNVLAGYFWLGEKDQIARKIIAAILAIGGIVLISLK